MATRSLHLTGEYYDPSPIIEPLQVDLFTESTVITYAERAEEVEECFASADEIPSLELTSSLITNVRTELEKTYFQVRSFFTDMVSGLQASAGKFGAQVVQAPLKVLLDKAETIKGLMYVLREIAARVIIIQGVDIPNEMMRLLSLCQLLDIITKARLQKLWNFLVMFLPRWVEPSEEPFTLRREYVNELRKLTRETNAIQQPEHNQNQNTGGNPEASDPNQINGGDAGQKQLAMDLSQRIAQAQAALNNQNQQNTNLQQNSNPGTAAPQNGPPINQNDQGSGNQNYAGTSGMVIRSASAPVPPLVDLTRPPPGFQQQVHFTPRTANLNLRFAQTQGSVTTGTVQGSANHYTAGNTLRMQSNNGQPGMNPTMAGTFSGSQGTAHNTTQSGTNPQVMQYNQTQSYQNLNLNQNVGMNTLNQNLGVNTLNQHLGPQARPTKSK